MDVVAAAVAHLEHHLIGVHAYTTCSHLSDLVGVRVESRPRCPRGHPRLQSGLVLLEQTGHSRVERLLKIEDLRELVQLLEIKIDGSFPDRER